ncbi:MAG: glycosyltransferase family 9 protein [Ignavibacteriaceae bacterium]
MFAYNGGNVVVISLHRLGDTVFTIPAVQQIINYYGRRITIVCFPESIPIYNLAFNDINFCEFKQEDFYFGKRIATIGSKKKLKTLRPSLIFDLTGSMISASLIYNIRAKEIIGTNSIQFRSIYDQFATFRLKPQLVDIYLDAISSVIQIPSGIRSKKQPIACHPDRKILIHPFAGWKEKEWNLKKFIELAEKIKNDYQVSLIMPRGFLSSDVLGEIANIQIEIIQTKSVTELIRNIEECSIFIGNDSGPVNIANFIGKPTLTLYGSTNPEYTATNLEHQIYSQKILNCSSKKNKKLCIVNAPVDKCPGIQCMQFLTVEEVYNNVINLARKYCKKNL